MSGRSRVVAVLVPLLVVTPLGAPVASAAPTDAGGSPAVMIVLDASGSMKAADAPGPRIDAAKKAVVDLIGRLPAGARVGLDVYGTQTSSADSAKAAGCRDIRQLVPVGPVDAAAFTQAVSGIRASGYTPIGAALRQAVAALPKEGPRSVVLVSDGQDTCAPPTACEVARQLKSQSIDLAVHTVGFKVDARTRAELGCIASATGGTYREANNGAALGTELSGRVNRALRPYQTVGTPVRGSASPASAPQLQPGQYLDTYDRGALRPGEMGTRKYYALRLARGQVPLVSATLIPPPFPTGYADDFAVRTRIVDAGRRQCASAASALEVGLGGKVRAPTAVLDSGAVGDQQWTQNGCAASGLFYVEAVRAGPSYRDTPVAMELAFRIQPTSGTAGLPGPIDGPEPPLPAPTPTAAKPLAGGSSYNDAPLLAPGTYSDTVVTGETRYYRVKLGYGQRLSHQITLTPKEGSLSTFVEARVSTPVRAKATLVGVATTGAFGREPRTLTGSTAAPVRYRNREATAPGVAPYWVTGDYYLELDTSYPGDRKFGSAAVTITISVLGEVEAGPGGEDPTSPESAAPSRTAAPPAGGTASGERTADGVPMWAWAVAAVGGAVALFGVALTLARRRRL